MFRGLKRILGDKREPMDPLLAADLAKIFQVINLDDELELSVWLAVCLAFRTLLSKGHFFKSQDEDAHLLYVKDVANHDWGILIRVSSSKTIQFSQRY